MPNRLAKLEEAFVIVAPRILIDGIVPLVVQHRLMFGLRSALAIEVADPFGTQRSTG